MIADSTGGGGAGGWEVDGWGGWVVGGWGGCDVDWGLASPGVSSHIPNKVWCAVNSSSS